jgi:hypothetical protein
LAERAVDDDKTMKKNHLEGLRTSTLIVFLLAAAYALPAVAAGPGWTINSTIKKLVVTQDGGVNVLLSPPLTGCLPQSGYPPTFASIYPLHPGINRMKAALLAAYLNGSTVALYLSDNTCKVTELILDEW